MKSRTGHNRRTFDILQIQQQISHYNHLIQARPDATTGGGSQQTAVSGGSQQTTPSRLRSKFYNELERSRLLENSKLVRKLTEIKHTKGLLHQDNYRERSSKASSSLQSDFKLVEEEKTRLKHNELLLGKLKMVRPQVGTCYQWNQHFQQFQNNQRKLSKVNLDLANLEDRFYNTYADMTSKRRRSRKKLISQHSKRSSTVKEKSSLKHCQHCLNPERAMPEEYTSDIQGGDKPSKVIEESHSNEESQDDSRQVMTRGNSLNNTEKKVKRRRKKKHRRNKQSLSSQHVVEGAAVHRQSTRNPDNPLHMYGSHS